MSEYPTDHNVLGYFNYGGKIVYKNQDGYWWNKQLFSSLELLDEKIKEINQVISRSIINPHGITIGNENGAFTNTNT